MDFIWRLGWNKYLNKEVKAQLYEEIRGDSLAIKDEDCKLQIATYPILLGSSFIDFVATKV